MFEKEAEEWVKENMDCCKTDNSVNQPIPYFDEEERCCAKSAFQDGAEFGYNRGLKAGRPKWHKLIEEYPDADKLVRVRLMSGMEHICETCYYEPTEDEIGYGKLVINFYELNGEWVDDNDIIAWCEIPKYTEE